MHNSQSDDKWLSGSIYDTYMGRLSRPLAAGFVTRLKAPPDGHWLDVGCGTGALAAAILKGGRPAGVVACDPSPAFVDYARRHEDDSLATFVVGGIGALPSRPGGFDAVVSSLVLNFLPDPVAGVGEMAAVAASGGIVAATVWDYAGEMRYLRYFWEEAVSLDPEAATADESRRFPVCQPETLRSVFGSAGLRDVETGALEVETLFRDFDDFWGPFEGGVGPAPAYVKSLDDSRRAELRARLARRLTPGSDGSIRLRSRAWMVRGRPPQARPRS